jgi:glycosyltransferase involved in cell wall biosynthesis
MLDYKPPRYIQDYLSFNYTPIDDIPSEVLQGVAERIKKLQSDKPLVSLILIAYNEQDYIFGTLLSISRIQSSYPLEIIVVNNNSTDDTQKFLDRTGVISVFEKEQGYANARQAGFKVCRGKYIISGDTDTLYPVNWVDPLIKPMERDDSVVCTYNRFRFYSEEEKYSFGLYLYEKARLLDAYFKAYKRPHLNVRGFSMAFRKDTAEKVGGYNIEVRRGSDGYLGIELLDHGKLEMVKDKSAEVYTNMRRTISHGGLFQTFMRRASTTFRYFFHMFTPQKER